MMQTKPYIYQIARCCYVLLLIVFQYSCSHQYYSPTDCHNVQLDEKGDLNISGGIGEIERGARNHNVQIGYSPIKHLGLAVNYSGVRGTKKLIPNQNINQNPIVSQNVTENGFVKVKKTNNRAFEAAIGGYWPIVRNGKTVPHNGKNITKPDLLFDLYLGTGLGEISNVFENFPDSLDTYNFTLNYRKTYLQGGVYWSNMNMSIKQDSLKVRIGLLLKLGILNFNSGIVNGNVATGTIKDLELLESNNPFRFIESTLYIGMGIKKVEVFVNLNYMPHLDIYNNHAALLGSTSCTFGVQLKLGDLIRLKKEQTEGI